MTKFIITGDLHLGIREPFPIRKERNEEFNSIFKQIIDTAIDNQVNFILVLGDLFDTSTPSPNTVNFIREQLFRLKLHDIKFYTIFGNHDAAWSSEIAETGISIDLIKLVDNDIVELIDPRIDKIRGIKTVGYRDYDGVRVYGIGWYKNETLQVLKSFITPEMIDPSKFNILLLHTYVEQVNSIRFGREKRIPINDIEAFGFDMVSIGHLHIQNHQKGIYKPKKTLYICPGSPINWTFEQIGTSSVYLVEINPELKKINYKQIFVESLYHTEQISIESKEPQPYDYYIDLLHKRIKDILTITRKQVLLSIRIRGLLEGEHKKIDGLELEKQILEQYKDRILYITGLRTIDLKYDIIDIEDFGDNILQPSEIEDKIISELLEKYLPPNLSASLLKIFGTIKETYTANYENLLKKGGLPKSISDKLDMDCKRELLNAIKNTNIADLEHIEPKPSKKPVQKPPEIVPQQEVVKIPTPIKTKIVEMEPDKQQKKKRGLENFF